MSLVSSTAKITSNTGIYDYPIENSLRFDGSSYLSRTPSTAGNRKTWTWSGWVKRGGLSSWQMIWAAGTAGGDRTYIAFNDTNFLVFNHVSNGTPAFYLTSDRVFRDLSAWYNIVVKSDLTNTNVDIYVNGEEITLTNTSGSVQNVDTYINNNTAHYISRSSIAATEYTNGYLANIQFIDGQALNATYFGETKSGVWIPKAYTGSYGTNGFHLTFEDATSTTTLGYDYSGNNNHWTLN